jgi:hypothetical protein
VEVREVCFCRCLHLYVLHTVFSPTVDFETYSVSSFSDDEEARQNKQLDFQIFFEALQKRVC